MAIVLPGHESGREDPALRVARHHHVSAYAAIVVEGAYVEAGDRGRYRAEAGDVLIHRAFDAHANVIGAKGARFLNIPLSGPIAAAFGSVDDVDAIMGLAEYGLAAAGAEFQRQFRADDRRESDWPDLLARALCGEEPVRLQHWADDHGLDPATISRGFARAYHVSPRRYRLERITSRAARRIASRRDTLSDVAAACGFADQPHMTRSIRALFGVTPTAIAASGVKYVQDGGE